MTSPKPAAPPGSSFVGHLRTWFLTGLLVLAPSAITMWVLFRLLNWGDNLLGRYLRFAALDYHRIPGLGLLTTALLLLIVGFVAGSSEALGEAFLSQKEETFRKVVLVQWPHPGIWRVGFLTGHVAQHVKDRIGQDVSCVFVPHTPNPASGFVHYVPKQDLVELDWAVEDGLKVIVSGGVVQPGMEPPALAGRR